MSSVGAPRNVAAAVALAAFLTGLVGGCTAESPGSAPLPPLDITDLAHASATAVVSGAFAFGAADGHIWTLDMETGVRTQVTHGAGGVDFDPHFSPDGTRLVFRTERFKARDPSSTGYDGIFVIDRDGTGERRINAPGGGLFPEWAPDGTVVFSGPRRDGTEGLLAARPDGTELRDLGIYAEHIGWSPSGKDVLLDRNDDGRGQQNWNIWRATSRFTEPKRLTDAAGDDHFGGWSPDGRHVVFSTTRTDDGDVWLMRDDGTDEQPLLVGHGPQSAEGWLSDGRILVADYSGTATAWYLLHPAGGSVHSVAALAGQQGPVDWTPR